MEPHTARLKIFTDCCVEPHSPLTHSLLTAAIDLPVGLKHTCSHPGAVPRSTRRFRPVLVSQSRIVLSKPRKPSPPAVATNLPSGLNAALFTAAVRSCPDNTA